MVKITGCHNNNTPHLQRKGVLNSAIQNNPNSDDFNQRKTRIVLQQLSFRHGLKKIDM